MGTSLNPLCLIQSEVTSPIEWHSLVNYAFLNPRLPDEDSKRLRALIESVADQFRGHIFLLTSGTSGLSGQDLKWVALSKSALLYSAAEVNRHLRLNSLEHPEQQEFQENQDVWLDVLPDFHVGGLGIRARSYLSGARVIRLTCWEPTEFVAQAVAHSATLASLVPAQIYDLVQNKLRCPASIRAVLVGGGALAPSLRQTASDLGWPLLITYGMTEACSQIATSSMTSISSNPKDGVRVAELELLPHWAARTSADGRLQIQGDSLLTAYIYSGSNGKTVVLDPRDDEGWFTTQDMVSIQGRRLDILGRTQDFIKIGGESVDLTRLRLILENIKLENDTIADVALIAVSDVRLGHVIHLVSDQALTNETASLITESFNRRVVAFEKIRKWTRLSALPRTPLGKLIINHESLQSIGTDRSSEAFQR